MSVMQNAAGSEFVENFYNLFAVNIVLEYFANYIYGILIRDYFVSCRFCSVAFPAD